MPRLPSLYPSERESKSWESKYGQFESTLATLDARATPADTGPTVKETRWPIVYTVVNEIIHKPKFQAILKANRLEVVGSIRQGTAVPKSKSFDVDLLLTSSDLKPKAYGDSNGFPHELKKIDKCFTECFTELSVEYEYVKTEKTSLEFNFKIKQRSVRVKLHLSPHWEDPKELFDILERIDPEKRELLIPSTMYLQARHIRYIDAEHRVCQHIHDLIQRAKAWRDVPNWPKDEHSVIQSPDSYLISLLVIKAFYDVPKSERHERLKQYADKVATKFKKFVKELGVVYDRDELPEPRDTELVAIREEYAHLLPAPWWLIDPANPTNNVYVSGMPGKRKDRGWRAFADKVDSVDLKLSVEQILQI